nr:hypothetical protein CFP56_62333 [Quercus suber]
MLTDVGSKSKLDDRCSGVLGLERWYKPLNLPVVKIELDAKLVVDLLSKAEVSSNAIDTILAYCKEGLSLDVAGVLYNRTKSAKPPIQRVLLFLVHKVKEEKNNHMSRYSHTS